LAEGDDEVFVIGGEQLFRCALPKADRLYLTVVHAFVDGDARFPDLDQREWRQVEEEQRTADEKNSFDCTFRTLDRSRD
jgi:dihydrofolate reductase